MRWRPDHPWFGPIGWGWRPISREGWIVIIAHFLLLGAVSALYSTQVLADAPAAGLHALLASIFVPVYVMASDTQDRTKR
jgi:hypothetical protein